MFLSVYAECHAECRYDECRYGQCHGANIRARAIFNRYFVLNYSNLAVIPLDFGWVYDIFCVYAAEKKFYSWACTINILRQ